MLKTALVITSISPPNDVLSLCADGCIKHGVDFIVVGDVKSPSVFNLHGCNFWSIEKQTKLPLKLASILPERHYARKNLGYLLAIERGADVIIETDDDNFPRDTFWNERFHQHKVALIEDVGWVNVYRYFTDSHIWPRGFPLEHFQKPVPPREQLSEKELFCPIQQGLADDNPDVDAIFRLTMTLPQQFNGNASVALGKGSWSPFNSQNTTWFKEAFPLLYIPSYCSFRMCDIWRSFIALRICWANNWGVLFHNPTVFQERNEHDILKDFSDEISGYLNNTLICNELANLEILKGSENLGDNMRKCYFAIVSLGLIQENEMQLLDAWLSDLS
jgi:STELLO glycosyltransferases